MPMQDQFLGSPTGAGLVMTPLDEREDYIRRLVTLPDGLLRMLGSGTTPAFIRGAVKQFKLEESMVPAAAFLTLKVAVGKLELSELGRTLASELKIPEEKAQGMAKEIEKELFGPVMRELNESLENRKKKIENSSDAAKKAGVLNVVDLKGKQKDEK